MYFVEFEELLLMIFHVSKLNVGLLRYEKIPTQISIKYKIVWNVYMWEKYEAPILDWKHGQQSQNAY